MRWFVLFATRKKQKATPFAKIVQFLPVLNALGTKALLRLSFATIVKESPVRFATPKRNLIVNIVYPAFARLAEILNQKTTYIAMIA